MSSTKAALIKRATQNVAHKRVAPNKTTIIGETITYKFGDTREILEQAKKGQRSAMIRAALIFANEAGALGYFKDYE